MRRKIGTMEQLEEWGSSHRSELTMDSLLKVKEHLRDNPPLSDLPLSYYEMRHFLNDPLVLEAEFPPYKTDEFSMLLHVEGLARPLQAVYSYLKSMSLLRPKVHQLERLPHLKAFIRVKSAHPYWWFPPTTLEVSLPELLWLFDLEEVWQSQLAKGLAKVLLSSERHELPAAELLTLLRTMNFAEGVQELSEQLYAEPEEREVFIQLCQQAEEAWKRGQRADLKSLFLEEPRFDLFVALQNEPLAEPISQQDIDELVLPLLWPEKEGLRQLYWLLNGDLAGLLREGRAPDLETLPELVMMWMAYPPEKAGVLKPDLLKAALAQIPHLPASWTENGAKPEDAFARYLNGLDWNKRLFRQDRLELADHALPDLAKACLIPENDITKELALLGAARAEIGQFYGQTGMDRAVQARWEKACSLDEVRQLLRDQLARLQPAAK